MKVYSIADLEKDGLCIVHGRHEGIFNHKKIDKDLKFGSVSLFHTGSAFEFNVTGSEFYVQLYTDYSAYEQWITVFINGAMLQRLMLPKGYFVLECFRKMNPDTVKNVKIIKEGQAFDSDKDQIFVGIEARCMGEFKPVEAQAYKLEFIGDSITSAEGCIGAKGDLDWIPMYFSGSNCYSYFTATELNAEYRTISQSGWGLLCGWDANPYSNIPEHYTKVCSLQRGDRQIAAGSDLCNDFNKWQPDVVVLNLGTNDTSAFRQPKWLGENGEEFELRCNEDGSFNAEDADFWIEAAKRFLRIIRANNTKAHIVWVLGMLGTDLAPLVNKAIEDYSAEMGDMNLGYLELEESNSETVGSREHPGLACHKAAAEKIVNYIRNLNL